MKWLVKIPLSFCSTSMRKRLCEKSANWENGANNGNFSDMFCLRIYFRIYLCSEFFSVVTFLTYMATRMKQMCAKTFNQFTICLHKDKYFSLNDAFVFLIIKYIHFFSNRTI